MTETVMIELIHSLRDILLKIIESLHKMEGRLMNSFIFLLIYN